MSHTVTGCHTLDEDQTRNVKLRANVTWRSAVLEPSRNKNSWPKTSSNQNERGAHVRLLTKPASDHFRDHTTDPRQHVTMVCHFQLYQIVKERIPTSTRRSLQITEACISQTRADAEKEIYDSWWR